MLEMMDLVMMLFWTVNIAPPPRQALDCMIAVTVHFCLFWLQMRLLNHLYCLPSVDSCGTL